MNELDAIEFSLTKAEIFYLMYKKELNSQDKAMERIEDEVKKTVAEISELQRQLDDAKIILKYKGEYEDLATIINQYKTKDELQKFLSEADVQKHKIDSDISLVSNRIEQKKKQLGLLTSLLFELKQSMVGAENDSSNAMCDVVPSSANPADEIEEIVD